MKPAPCHRTLIVDRVPRVWTFRGEAPGSMLIYRFIIDGREHLGGDNGSCRYPLRTNGLRFSVRWCKGKPLAVRYVGDHREVVRFEWGSF